MPMVRNLSNGAGSFTPAVSAPAPKPQENTSLAVSLSSFLASLPQVAPPVADPGASGNYVGSASTRSTNWSTLQAAGIADGDFYLAVDGQFVKQMPLCGWLVTAVETRTKMDNAGNITHATFDVREPHQFAKDDHFVTLMIVDMGGRLVPAKAEFRTTKSGAVVPAIQQLVQCQSPDWPSLGDAHKIAAACPVPFGRVYVRMSATPKTSKTSGNRYHAGTCQAGPATVEQMQRLITALQDEKFVAEMEAAGKLLQDRIEQLKKVA